MKRVVAFLLLCVLPIVALGQPDLAERGASVTLKVSSYADAQTSLTALVAKHGGTLADRKRVASPGGQHSGWSRVRIPKANLDAFLADVRGLGKILGERVTLADPAEEYVSLGHRAERLRQHEQRLQGILSSGRRLRGSDILFVQERLFRASVDEDSLVQQRDSLARRAGTSSVIVDFFEPSPVKEQPRGILGRTNAALTGALRGLAFSLLDSLETILRWIVYLFIFWLVWRVFRKPIVAAWRRFWASTSFGSEGQTKPLSDVTAPDTVVEPPR